MKLFTDIIKGLVIGSLFVALVYTCTKSDSYQKFAYPDKYASTNIPEYKESEVNKLKRELDDTRLEKMKLQAKLDTCKYFTQPCPEVTTKPVTKSKVKINIYKSKYDSTLTLLNNTRLKAAEIEINLEDKLRLKSRQLDTCGYYVNEFNKIAVKQSEELVKLTNKADSLQQIVNTPIASTQVFPCIKIKRGVTVTGHTNLDRELILSVNAFNKENVKLAKKQCKNKK